MVGLEGSLVPRFPDGRRPRALLVGFDKDSLDELVRLLDTAEVESVERMTVIVRKIHPGTYIGAGKIEEVERIAAESQVDLIVFDTDLPPTQVKNLEKLLKKPVLDRYAIILEIFSNHAHTKEAKTQVELARLEYSRSRLVRLWSHLDRQRGGGGGGGGASRGMGETQFEVDRRKIDRRITLLKKRLVEIEKERAVRRANRQEVQKVAFVGYTNAGKSTLLNAITNSDVKAEDKLFVTLDPSIRSLDPFSHPPLVAIDTVGFIRNLPTQLVASFRATLEEANDADLLVHVVDGSSPTARDEIKVTEEILKDIGAADTPRLLIINKVDKVKSPGELNWVRLVSPGAMRMSALNKDDVSRLREAIISHFKGQMEVWEVVIPYSESKLEAQLHAHGQVEKVKHLEKGTFYRVRIDKLWGQKLRLEKYPPGGKTK